MTLMTTAMILTGVNIVLVLGLLVVYVRSLLRVRSVFAAGLLIFALLFLLQNIVSFYFYLTMMPYFVAGLEGYVLTFTALQTVAFAILNWVTWK
jgi:hypothetical protein